MILSAARSGLAKLSRLVRGFFGTGDPAPAGRISRIGLAGSGLFLLTVGLFLFSVDNSTIIARVLAAALTGFGLFNLSITIAKRPSLGRSNQLALAGHLVALLSFYFFSTRFLNVIYTTDSMVATYMGVAKTLQLQNPYGFSIKPLLDQLGFPPSFYSPRIDGSFEFHLTYPALNFLTLIPFYLVGIHDLRDGVFFFHVLSLLIIFGLAPSRLKTLSIVPFALAGPVIVSSWTDSVWAFFILLSAVSWNRNRKTSFLLIGVAAAVKQIALAAAPFLIIRQLHENADGTNKQNIVKMMGLILSGFLVPNLPFLLSSPGSWWDATMAPYLPGPPALVPGGMGLSSILIDLGITVPFSFYLYASAAALIILAYAYNARFDRLNKYMWAFPMILFFFYHRSFPNYIVFWSFPLILEITRSKNIHLNLPIRIPRLGMPRLPMFGKFSWIFRRRLTPFLMIGIVLIAVLAGVAGLYVSRQSAPRVDIHVNTAFDPDNIGAATVLNVTLKNTGVQPILPVFFIKWNLLADVWNSSAATVLQPQSEQSYLVRATDALAAVPRGGAFRILVSDKLTQQLVAESDQFVSKVPAPGVLNPLFKWWTIDTAIGKKSPYGWRLTTNNVDLTTSGIQPLSTNTTTGLLALLNYTSPANGPAQLTLSQKLLFNATNVDLLVNETVSNSSDRSVLFGASVTDGTHLLYYVFSETATAVSTLNTSENTTIILPVSKSGWSPVSLRAAAIWASQGWAVPDQATISFFFRASATGVYYASIRQVESALPSASR